MWHEINKLSPCNNKTRDDYREKGTQCNYKTDQERSNSFKKRQRKNDLMCKNIKKYSNHIL